ncbi:MAG: hypothetical protein K6G51_06550 [Sphaerochaetaceae bacterium]|nr:hypothetical protein [Sphaerochaetaceae bacterium]
MLIDVTEARTITAEELSFAPRIEDKVVKRYKAGEVDILFEKGPRTLSGQDLVYIQYALVALYKGSYKYAVTVEKLDLRSLASSSGVSVKELQNDYGTKGFFVDAKVYQYGDGEREEFGPLQEVEKDEFILPFLMDILLDSIDSGEDPVEV